MLVTFHCTFMWMMRGPQPSVAHAAGAAKRRRERRLRQFLRHERLTVAMLLAESQHHAAPRGQSRARSGGWERDVLHGQVPEHPTPQAAGTQYSPMHVDDLPPAGGSRPDRLTEVRPQERAQRHTVEQIISAPMLDDPVPLMEEQLLVDAFAPHDIHVPEQVIEVPKILIDELSVRTPAREPQLAEQLVEVPTIVSFSSLQRIVEQNAGFSGGGLQDFLPGQSLSSSSHDPARASDALDAPGYGVFRTFPTEKSAECRAGQCGPAPARQLMDTGSL